MITASLAWALCHLHHRLSCAVPQLLLLPCWLQTLISLPHLGLSIPSLTSVHTHTLLLGSQRDGLIPDSFWTPSHTTALPCEGGFLLLMSSLYLPSCTMWQCSSVLLFPTSKESFAPWETTLQQAPNPSAFLWPFSCAHRSGLTMSSQGCRPCSSSGRHHQALCLLLSHHILRQQRHSKP